MTAQLSCSYDEIEEDEEDLSALDTLEFAGVLESGEFETAIASRPRDPLHAGDLAFAGSMSGNVDDVAVTSVALLADTQLEMGVLDSSDVSVSTVDAMSLYERLRTMCTQDFCAVATQMTTRSGRVIVSSITAADRRDRLAEFASSSILAVEHLELGQQHLLARVGEVEVWVHAVDEVRVFAALLSGTPVIEELLTSSTAALDEFRRSRGQA